MRRFVTIAIGLLFSCSAFAANEPKKNSGVEVKISAFASEKDKLAFSFKITMPKEIIVNMDGPWQLTIQESKGLEFEKTTIKKDAFDQKLPGFIGIAKLNSKEKTGVVKYTLTAFVCTKDKSSCYRDVHKGEANW